MFSLVKKDTIGLPGKPLTTNFLFPLFKPIMVKGFSLSLVSKHGITFLTISDLLTQNVHLVQNTLLTCTVSTRKFDLNELKKTVVCVWQFFVDHGLRTEIVEDALGILFLVEEFCSFGLKLLPQKTPSLLRALLPNAIQWN